MITAAGINEFNAYMFNDNYRIEKRDDEASGVGFAGTEHNKTEAEAIARYLTNYHGQFYVAVLNPKDVVRRALEFRKDTCRVKNRDDILKTMGVF